jgi:hypothetical protein
MDLKAKLGRCEEASIHSREFYIPCNQPAAWIVKNRDPSPYRMCEACAAHNVNNRGAKKLSRFVAEPV